MRWRTLTLGTLAVVIISRVPLIVSDTLLIYITWTKLRSWVALRESKRLSLSDILFRSGTCLISAQVRRDSLMSDFVHRNPVFRVRPAVKPTGHPCPDGSSDL